MTDDVMTSGKVYRYYKKMQNWNVLSKQVLITANKHWQLQITHHSYLRIGWVTALNEGCYLHIKQPVDFYILKISNSLVAFWQNN